MSRATSNVSSTTNGRPSRTYAKRVIRSEGGDGCARPTRSGMSREKGPFKTISPTTLRSRSSSNGNPCRNARSVTNTSIRGSRTCEDMTTNSRRRSRRIVRFFRATIRLNYKTCKVMGYTYRMGGSRNGSGGACYGGVRGVYASNHLRSRQDNSNRNGGRTSSINCNTSQVFWFGFRVGAPPTGGSTICVV